MRDLVERQGEEHCLADGGLCHADDDSQHPHDEFCFTSLTGSLDLHLREGTNSVKNLFDALDAKDSQIIELCDYVDQLELQLRELRQPTSIEQMD